VPRFLDGERLVPSPKSHDHGWAGSPDVLRSARPVLPEGLVLPWAESQQYSRIVGSALRFSLEARRLRNTIGTGFRLASVFISVSC